MSTVLRNGEGTYSITIDGEKYLGIATGLNNDVLKTVDRSNFLSVPGLLWTGNNVTKWPLTNILVQNNEIIPYGKWIPGKTLADTEINTEKLLNMALFFKELHSADYIPDKILSTGLYYTENNEIILFPGDMLELIASHQNEAYKVQFVDTYNHPELQGEAALCFTLAVLAYKMTTGTFPFIGEDSTTLRESIRRKEPLPPEYHVPGLKKNFSGFILSSLKPGSGKKADLSSWITLLEEIKQDGYIKALDAGTAENLRKEGELRKIKNERTFRRKLYFLKNWKLILGVLAGLFFAGVVLSAPLKKICAPPVTKGMTAEKVIHLYYESINTLDVETMSGCVTAGAGKADIKEITGIFVISRVRTGYEGKSGFIFAGDWLKKGSPPFKQGMNIYGITGLTISRLSANTFTADYTKWSTEIPPDSTGDVVTGKPVKAHFIDTLHTVKKRGAWVIDSIKRRQLND